MCREFTISFFSALGKKDGDLQYESTENGSCVVISLFGFTSRLHAVEEQDKISFNGELNTMLGTRSVSGEIILHDDEFHGFMLIRGHKIPVKGKLKQKGDDVS